MFASSYIAQLRERYGKNPNTDSLWSRRSRRVQRRPRLERLEQRCLLAGNPAISEFPVPTPTSRPSEITAGPDGDLWFTEQQANQIGRITPTGQVTEFSAGITPGSGPYGITAGPDGNIWFTESNASQIGRITSTGQVTEFSKGITAGSEPEGITTGPDGNLWFTESIGTIGRITPSGQVTEFSKGITSGCEPTGITAGPDGDLWFTEQSPAQIGRITPTGQITEFSAGITPRSTPLGITAGPDGNLWFTELSGNQIGRITPTGQVTEFSAGITAYSLPDGIVAGPNGDLWFTEYAGNQVGRITPAGQVSEFATGITPGSTPYGITVGPDGNVWFADYSGDSIGRLDMPLTGAPINILASQGVPFSGVVATFRDSDPSSRPGDFLVTTDWNDGTFSAGQVTENAAGTFYVTGSHTYAQPEVACPINVTIVDRDGSTTTVSSQATVESLPLDPVLALSVPALPAAPKGTALSDVLVGSFILRGTAFPVGDLSATVDWGDGSPVEVGFVVLDSEFGGVMRFDVRGDHTYVRDQQTPYTTTVRVNEDGVQVLSTTTTATVTNRPPQVTGIPVKMTRGLPFSAPIAYIVENLGLPAEPAGNFTATINWGDGTKPTAGTVAAIPGGDWVVGKHTYASSGPYMITVTVKEGSFTVVGTAEAFDPPAFPAAPSRHFHRGTAHPGHRAHASLTDGTAKPHRVGGPLASAHLQPAQLRKPVP